MCNSSSKTQISRLLPWISASAYLWLFVFIDRFCYHVWPYHFNSQWLRKQNDLARDLADYMT